MRAIVNRRYGPPEVMRLEEVDRPKPAEGQVLIEVRATSVNASDVEFLTARPAYIRGFGMFAPKFRVLGSDVAGTVVEVGPAVTEWKEGDDVFGDLLYSFGGFAEYCAAPATELTRKPPELSFEVAAALPQSAVIGVQGLRDRGVAEGMLVAINGAGGGAGTFAVQIAKRLGAEVTAIDSAAKLDLLRELGADHVVDYAKTDFTATGTTYDLILDLVAAHSMRDYHRALRPGGRYLMVGGHVPNLLAVNTVGRLLSRGDRTLELCIVTPNRGLDWVVDRVVAGDLRAVIDQTYPLEEAAEAVRHVAEGRAYGKVVVTVP